MCKVRIVELLDGHLTLRHLNYSTWSHDLMSGHLVKLEKVLDHLLLLCLDYLFLGSNAYHC